MILGRCVGILQECYFMLRLVTGLEQSFSLEL